MVETATAWVDLVSPSHPFFFNALLKELSHVKIKTTVRRKTETVDLADMIGFDYEIVGRDFDSTLLRKFGIPLRTAVLVIKAPKADVSLSSRDIMCILASKARGMPSIHFTDNDITARVDGLRIEEMYNRFESMATVNIVPEVFETSELTRWGTTSDRIYTFDGYKEDIYIAKFEPTKEFLNNIPFKDYVVLRPEALGSAYVDVQQSIVPKILECGIEAGLNFIYLPRGRGDEGYAQSFSNDRVYSPKRALDGLQLAWYSNGVLTGSGTMAREAACMGKPAVSFFPNLLLSVDKALVEDGSMLHTRDPIEIIDYLNSFSESAREPDKRRSEEVYEKLTDTVASLIDDLK